MDKEEEILMKMRPGCICKSIKLYKIIQAIEEGADTYEEVAKRTDIGGGSCDSKRCYEKVKILLDDKKRSDDHD